MTKLFPFFYSCLQIDRPHAQNPTQVPCLLVALVQTIYTTYGMTVFISELIHFRVGTPEELVQLRPVRFLSFHGWKPATHPSLSQGTYDHSLWLHGLF